MMTDDPILNCSSVHGTKSLRWGGKIGGVVDSQSVWAAQLEEAVAFGMAVTSKGYCFLLGSYGTLHTINVKTGEVEWTLSIPLEGISVSDCRVVDDYLIVEFFVIDLKTRSICADLREYVEKSPLKSGSPVEVHDSKIFRVVDTKLAPGRILIFDLGSKKSTLIDIGMTNLCMPDANNILGWRKEGDVHILSKFKIDTEEVEVVSDRVKLSRLILEGNQILTLNRAELALLDIDNGSIVWRSELESLVKPIDPTLAMQFRVAMCSDAIYIEQSGCLVAIDRASGKIIWTKQFERVQDVCIIGDLLYGISDDYNLIAIDRYSGQLVWSRQEHLPWASVKALANNVLFISASGDVLCFEWEVSKPYYSPARPN